MNKKLACILLVDDDEPTNYLNRIILEQSHCVTNIQVVRSGQDALNYLTNKGSFARNGREYPRPDLIFLDINMPAMDGWEFLEKYRQLPEDQKGRIVMIMLTTSLDPDDEQKAKEMPEIAGFRHKPLTKEMFEQTMREYFPGIC